MRTTSRFAGLLTAAALLGAAGCQGTIDNTTGSASTGNGNGGSSSTGTGTGGSSSTGTGTGGSSSTGTGTGGSSSTGTGTGGSSSVDGGAGGTTPCTPLPPLTRRLWRLSVEQWDAAVQTLLSLPMAMAPVLTSRGGEAGYAFFSDVS